MWSINKSAVALADGDNDGNGANVCWMFTVYQTYSKFFKCSNLFSTFCSHKRWVILIPSILFYFLYFFFFFLIGKCVKMCHQLNHVFWDEWKSAPFIKYQKTWFSWWHILTHLPIKKKKKIHLHLKPMCLNPETHWHWSWGNKFFEYISYMTKISTGDTYSVDIVWMLVNG